MKNSNKVLLTVVVCFLLGTIFVAATARIHLFAGRKWVWHDELTGKNITKNFSVDRFTELEVSGACNVLVQFGEKPSVSISADEGYISNIDISSIGSKLSIDTEHGVGWKREGKINITIITNHPLEKITLSGASHLDYMGINGNSLALEMNGASYCNLGGKVNLLQVETNGASNVNAKGLIANDVKLETAGATDIEVYARNSLEIDSSGMAKINYYGNPRNVVRDVAGMASINSMN